LLLAGCGDTEGEPRQCRVNADCASGVCLSDGSCAPLSDDAGTVGDGAGDGTIDDTPIGDDTDTASGSDALSDVTGDTGTSSDSTVLDGDAGSDRCVPNGDGVVSAAEVPLRAGYTAMFRVTTEVSSFTTEPDCAGDTCVWDLVEIDGVTVDEETTTDPLDGAWYADEPAFAEATYASRLGELDLSFLFFDICNQVQYGVFQVTDDAVLLLGIVSQREGDGTLLVYDPPLPTLRFPLEEGASWRVETTATGPLCNSWVDYEIDWTFEASVDARGELVTPFGTFDDVLRVNSRLERHLGVGVLPTEVRTHTFVAECFTTVASIVSEEGVAGAEFDQIAEVRRLTLLP
jgi:hypothetical protein